MGPMDHPVFGNTWMAWNLFLALIPAALALGLFRRGARRTVLWWVGLATFIAFLPNAAYVLTDAIHLPDDLRLAYPDPVLTSAVLGSYAAFAAIGFTAYAFSVLRLMDYLRAQGLGGGALLATELSVHLLVTVGVVLGRVFRFNSWDLVARPDEVLAAVRIPQTERGITAVALFLATLVAGTLVVRWATVALRRRPRS